MSEDWKKWFSSLYSGLSPQENEAKSILSSGVICLISKSEAENWIFSSIRFDNTMVVVRHFGFVLFYADFFFIRNVLGHHILHPTPECVDVLFCQCWNRSLLYHLIWIFCKSNYLIWLVKASSVKSFMINFQWGIVSFWKMVGKDFVASVDGSGENVVTIQSPT